MVKKENMNQLISNTNGTKESESQPPGETNQSLRLKHWKKSNRRDNNQMSSKAKEVKERKY